MVAVDLRGVGGSAAPSDTPILGIEPFLELDIDVPLWHGEFHMIPDLPEQLVAGRQAVYFRYFFNVGTNDNSVITDADVEHYANAYGDQEPSSQLRLDQRAGRGPRERQALPRRGAT